MLRNILLIVAAATTLASATTAHATEPEAVKPNYELAEKFSPTKVRRLVPQTVVHPRWFKNSNKFW